MNDYFDALELGLRDAVRRRAHLPWYRRLGQLPVRRRSLAALVAALVIATPTVAAVGAVSGWFGKGTADVYYPASATKGLGKVLPKDGRLLPIRVADPDGGPPWGIRLVKTSRGETCIQVGRVVDGQIGALGIDGAWRDDHQFHEIKPNDQLADICGATDAAGDGFVNQRAYGAPASVDVPLWNSNGASGACRDPYMSLAPPALARHGGKLPPSFKKMLQGIERQRRNDAACPLHAMRIVFAGLLGPDAKRITYKTPDGQTRTEQTAGGVGAYLIVFRETATDCLDFTESLGYRIGGGCGPDNSEGASPDLHGPSAVTSVTYASGRTCSDQPSASFAAAYRKFAHETRNLRGKRDRQAWSRFFAEHHLGRQAQMNAVQPMCQPVGWVTPKLPKLTTAVVASPIKLRVSEGVRFCVSGSQVGTFDGAVPCDQRVPRGDRFLYGAGSGQKAVLVTISFTARQPVTSANSYYEWEIEGPGHSGGGGGPVDRNIRAGQRITLSQFVGTMAPGTYHGTVAFVQSAGEQGPGSTPLFLQPRSSRHQSGTFVVGRFSFKLPLRH